MSYFQAYSNTYKPVQELEKIYNSALNHPDIVGISIGTRPDCVDDEKLNSFHHTKMTTILGLNMVSNQSTIKH